jgi:hypothetical protein
LEYAVDREYQEGTAGICEDPEFPADTCAPADQRLAAAAAWTDEADEPKNPDTPAGPAIP